MFNPYILTSIMKTINPKNNFVYYSVGTPISWKGKSGVVEEIHKKPYDYPIGYNIRLNETKELIINVGYNEIS